MRDKPILFDQYNRYSICCKLIEKLPGSNLTILDIGSGPECILGEFLPDKNITFVDPLLERNDKEKRTISGDIYAKELNNSKFDIVTNIDVLEHVPPEERETFLQRLIELSEEYVILGAPCSDLEGATELDKWVNDVYKIGFNKSYSWLQDHIEYGLPSQAEVVGYFNKIGWQTAVYPNGYIPWLKTLLALTVCGLESKKLEKQLYSLSDYFNAELNKYADRKPNYRAIIVASRHKKNISGLLDSPTEVEIRESSVTDKWDKVQQEIIALPAKALKEVEEEKKEVEKEKKEVEEEKEDYVRRLSVSLKKAASIVNELDAHKEMLDLEKRSVDSLKTQLDTAINQVFVLNEQIQAIYQTRSWRMTAPLRHTVRGIKIIRVLGMREGCFQVAKKAYQKLPVTQYTKYKLKKPFNKFVELLRPKRDAKKVPINTSIDLLKLEKQCKPDVFIWAVIDWQFRKQRPQHLAEELARRGYRVFYISATFTRGKTAGIEACALSETKPLYLVKFNLAEIPHIHVAMPGREHIEQLNSGLSIMLNWTNSREAISIVNHPWWFEIAKSLPNSKLIYDCMDYHEGFGDYCDGKRRSERNLLETADGVIATSAKIYDWCAEYSDNVKLIRNACDFNYFCNRPDEIYSSAKKIIGYFGAIAEWFDHDLVAQVAVTYPDAEIVLVGNDTANIKGELSDFENVTFIGEVVYEKLTFYLHAFDVCILPFVKNALTDATNPVKVYEYFSAGKPVISIDLPEMQKFLPHIDIASSKKEFVKLVGERLTRNEGEADRVRFAKNNTWKKRVDRIETDIFNAKDPLISIIVITYNNLELTKKCFSSIIDNTDYPNYEVIVVDNDSADSSPAYISEFVENKTNWLSILNDSNLGFAPAVNQGFKRSKGEYLVVLNNDVMVTPGWLRTLAGHVKRMNMIGIVGPVTNDIGNEAKIEIEYSDYDEMLKQARQVIINNVGKYLEINTLAFFCVMIPRDVYEEVGGLDERYTVGFFEDDDYCRRVENSGYRIICVEDVFVHHEHSASFNALGEKKRLDIFENNKKLYEEKWGKWAPHNYRN